MQSIDVFTCYTLAGAGSLVGLLLVSLVRVAHPRLRRALWLYRMAFLCIASLLLVGFVAPQDRAGVTLRVVAVAASGATLLAWGFRQLGGQHTPVSLGLGLTLGVGGLLWWAGQHTPMAVFSVLEAAVLSAIALVTLIDQGTLMLGAARLGAPRRRGGEVALLAVAGLFSLDWLLILWHTLHWQGPYPDHLLFAPAGLLPVSAVGVALLPLSIASVVFAIVNDQLNEQLRERSLRDDLTGALSRRGLRERGERMLAGQEAAGIAVLMLDVDHFKAINDRHGHLVGDEVLRHLARLLRDHLRDDALLARYGGEEFTVLLPMRSRQDAETVAERLRQVTEAQPCLSRAGPIRATISVGVAFHQAAHSLDEVLSRADARLYEAKQAGRNRVVCEPVPA